MLRAGDGQSLLGKFGKPAQEVAEEWIGMNAVHFVASDAHNVTTRPLRLKEVFEHVVKKRGEDVARALLVDNPRAVFEGKSLPWVPEMDEDVGLAPDRAREEAQEVLVFLEFLRGKAAASCRTPRLPPRLARLRGRRRDHQRDDSFKQFEDFFVALEGGDQVGAGDAFVAGGAGPIEHAAGEDEAAFAGMFAGFFHFAQGGFGDDDAGDLVIEAQGLLVTGERPKADDDGTGDFPPRRWRKACQCSGSKIG